MDSILTARYVTIFCTCSKFIGVKNEGKELNTVPDGYNTKELAAKQQWPYMYAK